MPEREELRYRRMEPPGPWEPEPNPEFVVPFGLRSFGTPYAEVLSAHAFLDIFNPDVLEEKVRPTRILVVSQDPAPGGVVPAGTAVSVTTSAKEELPLDAFDVADVLATSFTDIGALFDVVEEQEAVRGVVAKDVPYAELSAADKTNFDQFVNPLLSGTEATAEVKARVLDDVRNMYKL